MKNRPQPKFAICLRNRNCEDLILRKIYPVLPDPKAEKENLLRIIDESGEDYLYPADYFFGVTLPQKVERSLRRTIPATAGV